MAAPTSSNVSFTILEDVPKVFSTTDFPFSDADVADILTYVKITALPTKGKLTVNGVAVALNQLVTAASISAGVFVYTPALNENGAPYTTFKFSVSDGIEYSVAYTATINVTAVLDVPPTSVSSTISINQNTARVLTASDFNFSDTDGGTSLTDVQIMTLPSHGTLLLNGLSFTAGRLISVSDINNGSLVYTPAYNGVGTAYAAFDYKVSDGQFLSSVYTITFDVVDVNDAPIDIPYAIIVQKNNVLSSRLPIAADADGDNILYSVDTLPTYGTLIINTDGTFVYTPTAEYTGSDSFKYEVSDINGGSNVYTVTITVVSSITIPISDVTDGTSSVTGGGAFDVFMQAIVAHLTVEYDKRRITSEAYPQIYLGAMQTALTQAVTFALQKPLVEKQAMSEEAKVGLIIRQTKGFDDDAKQKLLKQALDSWAVAYSVAQDANAIPDAIKVNPIDSIMKNAMDALSITKSNNPLSEI